MGFIDGPEDVIELERGLLSFVFDQLNRHCRSAITSHRGAPLPSLEHAPVWDFEECFGRLRRADIGDDLDPEAERELCRQAEREHGVPAVFVLGFPMTARPFYTHPRAGAAGAAYAAGFDLLFDGVEITTGGQRLHRRTDLEAALRARGMAPEDFESHLRMFDVGMPPHGGLAIGLERLTAQLLRLSNVRDATLYPRDRYRLSP